jgi:hypothetical protein
MFVRRLMSQAIPVAEEWVPPGLSIYGRARWGRLTGEQREMVKRMYEEFKRFVEGLDRRMLTETLLMREGMEMSSRIGASCRIYLGTKDELPRHMGKFADDYYVDGAKTSVSLSVVHERGRRIGLRCDIGRDSAGRETSVDMEVPAEFVHYTLSVYGDHSTSSQSAIWVMRVKRKEPAISFW